MLVCVLTVTRIITKGCQANWIRSDCRPIRWWWKRTFSWLSQNWHMSKDYERLCTISEAFIYVAMTRLMVRRLARS